jgi:hypothetical protein
MGKESVRVGVEREFLPVIWSRVGGVRMRCGGSVMEFWCIKTVFFAEGEKVRDRGE